MKTIFIFAYYSYFDPVFQSAVLPYFTNFPQKDQFKFVLITFEQKKYRTTNKQRLAIKEFLFQQNIRWYNVNWHSGKFKLIKKIYDFLVAFFLSAWIIVKHRVDIIYSEAFPGAIITHFLSRLFRRPHIVHSFEPHTEYMVEGGVWKKNSWEAKLLRHFEKEIAHKAYAIMTATGAMAERLRKDGVKAKIIRVPSCVDTQHFTFLPKARQEVRKMLNIPDSECVIICIGKMGGMYWEAEIFRFFQACLLQDQRFRFLFYTPDDQNKISQYARQYSIPENKITSGFLKRDEVPQYLSAADFGLVPVHQYPSKRFCSPIKDGEYWACELPIVIPAGVSDDFEFVKEKCLGFVLDDTSDASFIKAAQAIIKTWQDEVGNEEMRERCRKFVKADRDVAVYKEVYKKIFLQV